MQNPFDRFSLIFFRQSLFYQFLGLLATDFLKESLENALFNLSLRKGQKESNSLHPFH